MNVSNARKKRMLPRAASSQTHALIDDRQSAAPHMLDNLMVHIAKLNTNGGPLRVEAVTRR
jgi:hypothetical protein